MICEQDIETAVKAGINAALTAAGVSATVRAWLVDDASTAADEPVAYPAVIIVSHPGLPDADLRSDGPAYRIRTSIVCATHNAHDPKRSVLVSLYAAVRDALEAWDAEAQGFAGTDLQQYMTQHSFDGLLITDGISDIQDNVQSLEMMVDFYIRSVTTTTTTTTTT